MDERKRTDLKTAAKIPGDERKNIQGSETHFAEGRIRGTVYQNICEEAGVSNGSFYHHFKTKDDLLSYYIEDQPQIEPNLLELPDSVQAVKDGIIQVYLNYVKYCRELGVEFMSGYYDTKNQALNADIRTERPYPIVTVRAYVEKAVQAGVAVLNEPIEEFTTDIRMIVIGNVFEWCIKHGKADFEGNMSRSLDVISTGRFAKRFADERQTKQNIKSGRSL